MPQRPRLLLIPGLLLLLVLALVAASPLAAQPDPRLDARLIVALENEGSADTLIVLADRPDLSPAYSLPGKEARGRWVYETLRAAAARSQPSLLAVLDEEGITYRRYWAVNAVWARLDAAALQRVLEMPEVAAVRADAPYRGIEPLPAEELAAARVTSIPWGIDRVEAPWAWSKGYTGEGVTLSGQDTGYDWDHEAIFNAYRGYDADAGTVDHNYNWHDAITQPIVTGTNPCGYGTLVPCDDHSSSHGTHTMGTMVGNDLDPANPAWPAGAEHAIGVAPSARWIGCRNMDRGVGRLSTYLDCFEWLTAPYPFGGNPLEDGDPGRAPDVISNSWSCPLPSSPGPTECAADEMTLIEPAVNTADAAGVVVVVSAGNYGPSCGTIQDPPAIYPRSLAVGNTNSADNLAGSSSRGPVTYLGQTYIKPDLAAPGSSVLSSTNNDAYALLSGTSMAAPHVAGVIALLLDAAPALRGNTDLIKAIVARTADPITDFVCGGDPSGLPNNRFGWGIANARRAIESLQETGFLTAHVGDAKGQPIAKAIVRVFDEKGVQVTKAGSDAFGDVSFQLGYGTYRVQVLSAPYASASAEPVLVVGGQTTQLQFTLESIQLYAPLILK